MPIVCRNRPNRSYIRHFTPRDVRRIARYAAEHHPVRDIIIGVIVALGLSVLVCKAADAVHRSLGVVGVLKRLAAVLATASLYQVIKTILSRVLRSPLARVPAVAASVIALIFLVDALHKGALSLVSDLETIEDLSATLDDWCEGAAELLKLG